MVVKEIVDLQFLCACTPLTQVCTHEHEYIQNYTHQCIHIMHVLTGTRMHAYTQRTGLCTSAEVCSAVDWEMTLLVPFTILILQLITDLIDPMPLLCLLEHCPILATVPVRTLTHSGFWLCCVLLQIFGGNVLN